MAIYIIRHTDKKVKTNKEEKELLLTFKGVIQAQSLGYRLLNEKEDFSKYRFIASPKIRTQHTLQLIMEVLGVSDKLIEIEPLITTKDKGFFESMTKAEIKAKFAEELKKKEEDIWNWRYPNGESYSEQYERILKFLDKYKDVENMIVVSHEGICSVIMEIFKGKTKEEIMKVRKNLEYDQNYCYVKYNDNTIKMI